MNKYFSKLPNQLFFVYDNDIIDKSILEQVEYDYKVLLVLDYLYTNTNRKGITMFTLEDIVISCGFKPDAHKNKINDKFKNILVTLQKQNIIVTDTDLNKIKAKEFIKCKIDIFEKDDNDNDIKFIQLFDSEKDKILNYDKEKIDNLKMLYYYCHLKARMFKRAKGDDINVSGGRAEVCYPTYKSIQFDLKLTDEVISKYNNILVELNLIRIGNAGLFYYLTDKNKVVRESPNIYTLWTKNQDEWKNNLKEGIKFYKKIHEDERVFKNTRQYQNNNKKINGYIARVEYLEREGKATEEQIQKKNEYKKSVNIDEKIQRRITLFEKEENKGMLLSEIFDFYGSVKKFEKALKLEKSLGLLNENDDLAVDYDYYKWVMTNYTEDKHDYFMNCIKKHILEK
ncbi:TPA: hypothetical protein ACXDAY_002939 [Clostridium botulinum]|uniref:hypothetical protein n=2 Tax=Clostridium botulinum TaxID=1491 RepID=UPI00035BA9F9|nr:hypothetical protein [Clostridium botulinum]APH23452.1 hypothetical protein NPD1_3301 [Clostridium botulinum]APQ68946.1 hypothetical protein RSJ8_1427 [Clostridium botulinum]EPS56304.1 hypothetical protein CLQ_12433 [Clostridium botulinum Af84]MBN3351852.1 hypothetical protein [Clostridium botulinum]MBN3359447.1 hypothetical protein [Clostridium botulinum]